VLQDCADIAASAPDGLTAQVGCIAGPDGSPVVFAVPTWCGAPEEGEARTAPFLKLGTLLGGAVKPTSYRASLTAFDPFIVNGQRALMETCWLPAIDSRGIDALIGAMESAISPGCAIFTHEFKGAAARIPESATAFGLRRDHVLVEILAAFPGQADRIEEQRHRAWARAALSGKMGGYGSGMWRVSRRPLAETMRRIDLATLRRDAPPLTARHTLQIKYYNTADEQVQLTTVYLESMRMYFGGRRLWFRCPRCEGRCRVLYGT
jgi:hypothetical protein